MAYGVMFNVEKDYPTSSKKFKDLLKAINVDEYVWKIDESDFYNCADLQNILEKKQIIQRKNIMKELDCDVMMIWIALEGYKNETEIEELDSSFQKYLESECEVVVFVVDTYQFVVYTKNAEILKNAVEFAKANNTGRIEIIEEDHADWYFGV